MRIYPHYFESIYLKIRLPGFASDWADFIAKVNERDEKCVGSAFEWKSFNWTQNLWAATAGPEKLFLTILKLQITPNYIDLSGCAHTWINDKIQLVRATYLVPDEKHWCGRIGVYWYSGAKLSMSFETCRYRLLTGHLSNRYIQGDVCIAMQRALLRNTWNCLRYFEISSPSLWNSKNCLK